MYTSINLTIKRKLQAITTHKILLFILKLVFILYVIDFRLYLSLRIADILLIVLFLITMSMKLWHRKPFAIPKNILIPFLLWSLMFFIGIPIGIMKFGFLFEKGILIYKYSLCLLIIPFVITEIVHTKVEVRSLIKYWTASFVFLSLWTYIRLVLIAEKNLLLQAKGPYFLTIRPDFPFRTEILGVSSSAGHLYSVYLTFGLMALFLIKRFIEKTPFKIYHVIFSIISIGSILLCGSRGGPLCLILVSGGFLLNYEIMIVRKLLSKDNLGGFKVNRLNLIFLQLKFSIKKMRESEHYSIVKYSIFGIILLMVPLYLYIKSIMQDPLTHQYILLSLVTRTFDYLFLSDGGSTSIRLSNISTTFQSIRSMGYLIGNGPFGPSFWIDNGILQLINCSGVVGLLLFSKGIFNWLKNTKERAIKCNEYPTFMIFKYLLFYYILTNSIVTEFFLVTRSVVPALGLLMLLYMNISTSENCKNLKK